MGRDTVSKPCIHAEDSVHARRPAPNPGPRCATCWRRVKRERRVKARADRVEATYGITGEEYEALRQDQHGLCAICGPWTGRRGVTRSLSVDHDHRTGEVRGLLCRTCNDIIGLWRDNPNVFKRALEYLVNPPARRVLAPRDWSPYRGGR